MEEKKKPNRVNPKQKRKSLEKDNEFGLTKMQHEFCQAYVFLTPFDGTESARIAGYNFNDDKNLNKQARLNLQNPKVRKYIAALVDDRNVQTIYDKLWVVEKLKALATNAESETVQFQATTKLGQDLGMFVEKQEINHINSPGEIAKKAFELRKKKEKNVIPFETTQKEVNDG